MNRTALTKEQIEDLLEYIGVQRVGQWKGDNIQFCCPIHGESHPSCGICADYTPKDEIGAHYQTFHCFSCGASGSLVWFLYKSLPDEFKSIYDAEKFFSDRYGVDYNHLVLELKNRRIKRLNANGSKSVQHKHETLSMTKLAPFKSGKATYKYFFKRGFDVEDMREWMVGRDKESRTVTVPVFWGGGELAGIIGRYIDPDRPKNMRYRIYDFHKSKLIFPENKLQVVDDTIIGVEGMFDCMLMHKWGRPNTISIMGNKMSREQADYIASHCKKFIALWDNDDGGEKADYIARKRLDGRVDYLTCDYSIITSGKDPTEWGEIQTNTLISTASLLGKKQIRRI